MCSGSWPNFDAWLQTAWGAGAEFWSSWGCGAGVIGLRFGSNPLYYLDDFLSIYPKFFGTPTVVAGCSVVTGTSNVGVPGGTAGMAVGQFFTSAAFPTGSVIVSVASASIVVNTSALITGSGVMLQVYENQPVPPVVVQMYLNLAVSSLQVDQWGAEQWSVAIGWFIAHYCTLYAETDVADMEAGIITVIHGEIPAGAIPGTVYTLSTTPPAGVLQSLTKNGLFLMPSTDYMLVNNQITLTVATVLNDALYTTWPVPQESFSSSLPVGAQIAAQAVASGILTSKSVGDVSASYAVLAALEQWGAWNLTKYGQLLATMANDVGSGPLLVW